MNSFRLSTQLVPKVSERSSHLTSLDSERLTIQLTPCSMFKIHHQVLMVLERVDMEAAMAVVAAATEGLRAAVPVVVATEVVNRSKWAATVVVAVEEVVVMVVANNSNFRVTTQI